MIYKLPRPIAAGYSYDSLRVENVQYDPTARAYTADVFGVVDGIPMPLIFQTVGGLHRVPTCTITDDEINAVMAENVEITDRLQAGMKRAMERLYGMVNA